MITTIKYFDKANTQIIVMRDTGYNNLYLADYRDEEIDAWLAEHSIEAWVDPTDWMDKLRGERNNRLTACDWTQVADSPHLDDPDWLTYRQALRDFPASHPITTEAEYLALEWPTPPEE